MGSKHRNPQEIRKHRNGFCNDTHTYIYIYIFSSEQKGFRHTYLQAQYIYIYTYIYIYRDRYSIVWWKYHEKVPMYVRPFRSTIDMKVLGLSCVLVTIYGKKMQETSHLVFTSHEQQKKIRYQNNSTQLRTAIQHIVLNQGLLYSWAKTGQTVFVDRSALHSYRDMSNTRLSVARPHQGQACTMPALIYHEIYRMKFTKHPFTNHSA